MGSVPSRRRARRPPVQTEYSVRMTWLDHPPLSQPKSPCQTELRPRHRQWGGHPLKRAGAARQLPRNRPVDRASRQIAGFRAAQRPPCRAAPAAASADPHAPARRGVDGGGRRCRPVQRMRQPGQPRPLRHLHRSRRATAAWSASWRAWATFGRWSGQSVHRGLYHVLGGTLSALGGVGPEDLNLRPLLGAGRGGRRGGGDPRPRRNRGRRQHGALAG